MNRAPESIRMLLMPENKAVATKARRQALSAAASSELAGCCRGGPRLWLMDRAYHRNGRQMPSAHANDRQPQIHAGTCDPPDQITNTILLVSDSYIYIGAGSRPLVNSPRRMFRSHLPTVTTGARPDAAPIA